MAGMFYKGGGFSRSTQESDADIRQRECESIMRSIEQMCEQRIPVTCEDSFICFKQDLVTIAKLIQRGKKNIR